MRVSSAISSLLLLSAKYAHALKKECVSLTASDTPIDLYLGPDSPPDDPLVGSYLSPSAPFILAEMTRIKIFSMEAACTESEGGLRTAPSCNFKVTLGFYDCTGNTRCNWNSETYRDGTFNFSGQQGDTEYVISGGTDYFGDASGVVLATYDPVTRGYSDMDIQMCYVHPEVNDPIRCINNSDNSGNPLKIYRLTDDNRIRHYPLPPFATDWENEWFRIVKDIDCSGMIVQEEMSMKPDGVDDGQSVNCVDSVDGFGNSRRDGLYRFTNSRLRYYLSPRIAESWDPLWYTAPTVTCAGIPFGNPMVVKPDIEAGDSVKCINNSDGSGIASKIYYFTGEELRFYPSPSIAYSWSTTWYQYKEADCTGIRISPDDLFLKPAGLVEGASVRCSDNTDYSGNPNKIYRFTNASIRHYPDEIFAKSWDPLWHINIETIICTDIPIGNDMPMFKERKSYF
jgi:hypothetical protein